MNHKRWWGRGGGVFDKGKERAAACINRASGYDSIGDHTAF